MADGYLGAFAVLVVLLVATFACGVWAFLYLLSRLNTRDDGVKTAAKSVRTEVRGLAEDVDKKFDYYARDPTGALTIKDDGTSVYMGFGGIGGSQLDVGKGKIAFADDGLTVGTHTGTANIGISKDTVTIGASKIKFGGYTFQMGSNGLQVCPASGATTGCSVIQTTPVR